MEIRQAKEEYTMKKRMAAGLLLVLLCTGCAAAPAQNFGAASESQNPAENAMRKEETDPETTQARENTEHKITQEAQMAVQSAMYLHESLYAAGLFHEEDETAAAGQSQGEAETETTGQSQTAAKAETTVQSQAAAETETAGLSNKEGKTTMADAEPDETGMTLYADGFSYEPINDEVKQRIYGLSYKEDCTVPYEELRYVRVRYIDFDGLSQEGELICNKAIAQDLVEIFYELYQASYPIEKIRLIDEYNADDDLSCLDNNTSCFNYRVVGGSTNLSKHALGLAIDINPFYNPYVTYPNGVERISPPGSEPYADRSLDFPYKIDESDLCYQLFAAHGFTWGGHWKTLKDYQHFQKSL